MRGGGAPGEEELRWPAEKRAGGSVDGAAGERILRRSCGCGLREGEELPTRGRSSRRGGAPAAGGFAGVRSCEQAETRASARERGSRFPNRSASVAFPIAVAERKSNANAAFAMETVASRLAGLSCFSRRERAMSGTKQGLNVATAHMSDWMLHRRPERSAAVVPIGSVHVAVRQQTWQVLSWKSEAPDARPNEAMSASAGGVSARPGIAMPRRERNNPGEVSGVTMISTCWFNGQLDF